MIDFRLKKKAEDKKIKIEIRRINIDGKRKSA